MPTSSEASCRGGCGVLGRCEGVVFEGVALDDIVYEGVVREGVVARIVLI